MESKPSLDELRSRIQEDIDHFGGQLPERYALVWNGYLAALIEWSMISVHEHELLTGMLPKVENNPVITILIGRPNEAGGNVDTAP